MSEANSGLVTQFREDKPEPGLFSQKRELYLYFTERYIKHREVERLTRGVSSSRRRKWTNLLKYPSLQGTNYVVVAMAKKVKICKGKGYFRQIKSRQSEPYLPLELSPSQKCPFWFYFMRGMFQFVTSRSRS